MTEAIGELYVALKDEQAPRVVRQMLADFYLQAGRKNDLKKFYDENIEKFPDDVDWHFQAGRFALLEGQGERGEGLMRKAWELSQKTGGSKEALDGYLESLWRQGRYKELLTYASDYIDTEFAAIAYAQMGQAQFKLGDMEAAVSNYHKSLEKVGSDENLIMAILRNMSEIIGPGSAERWCIQKLETQPDSMPANLTMFNISLQKGEYNKALKYIDKCLETTDEENPEWITYAVKKVNVLTAAYDKTSDEEYLSRSITESEKVLAKQPNNVSVLNNIAYLLADYDRNIPKAVEYSKRAHERSPNDAGVMDTYAYALIKNGEYGKAQETLQMAIQLFEVNNTAVPWDVYKHLGMAYEGLGQNADAVLSYNQSLEAGKGRMSNKNKEQLEEMIRRLSE